MATIMISNTGKVKAKTKARFFLINSFMFFGFIVKELIIPWFGKVFFEAFGN